IHGRNRKAVEELSRFIRAIGLRPWPFEEVRATMSTPHPVIDDIVWHGISRSAATVALFTPDERAKLRVDFEFPNDDPRDRARWQCRANVLYETGLALAMNRGSPSPQKQRSTLIAIAGNVRLPSDFDGRFLFYLNNDPLQRDLLRKHFVDCGCS